VPIAGTAVAQPSPPVLPAPPITGDLHVRIVQEAPPPGRHEVAIAPPGPNHVWITGYWHHMGQKWAWSDGRWAEPPRPHARWVVARYQKVQGGTRYIPGHWSYQHVIYN